MCQYEYAIYRYNNHLDLIGCNITNIYNAENYIDVLICYLQMKKSKECLEYDNARYILCTFAKNKYLDKYADTDAFIHTKSLVLDYNNRIMHQSQENVIKLVEV